MSENVPSQGQTGWTPEPVQEEEPRTLASRIIEIVLWFALFGLVAGVAIPEIAGRPIDDKGMLSALLGFVGLPFLIARLRRARMPWLYPLVGLGLFFAIPMAGGYMRGTEKKDQEDEFLAAIEAFDPETAKRMRAAGKDETLLASLMVPAIRRAMERAPDQELVAYTDDLFKLVDTPAGINRQRCAELTGGARQTPKSSAEQIYIGQANARLFRAASHRPQPVEFDRDRAVALRRDLLKVADRDGVLADPAKLQAMTVEDRCGLYVRMMQGLRKLPVSDAALILRGNVAASATD